MAIDGGDVKFTFSGDSSQLRAELDNLSDSLQEVNDSGQGAANALDDDLGRAADSTAESITASAGAVEDASEGQKKLRDRAIETAEGFERAGGGISNAGAIISQFNPEAGEAVSLMGDMTTQASAMVKSMIESPAAFAAAAAAATLYALAMKEVNERQEKHDQALERAQQIQDQQNNILARRASLETEIANRLAVSIGQGETAYDVWHAAWEQSNAQAEAEERHIRRQGLTEDATNRHISAIRGRRAARADDLEQLYLLDLAEEQLTARMDEATESIARQLRRLDTYRQGTSLARLSVAEFITAEGGLFDVMGETTDAMGAARHAAREYQEEYSRGASMVDTFADTEEVLQQRLLEQLGPLQENQRAWEQLLATQSASGEMREINEGAFERQVGQHLLMVDMIGEETDANYQLVLGNGEVITSIDQVSDAITGNVSDYETLIAVQDKETGLLMTMVQLQERLFRERQARARAARQAAEAEARRQEAAAAAAQARWDTEQAAAEASLLAQTDALRLKTQNYADSQLDELSLLDVQHQRELAAIDAQLEAQREAAAEYELSLDQVAALEAAALEARAAADAEYRQTRVATEKRISDELQAINDERRAQDLADERALQQAYLGGWSDLSGTIADVYADKADKMAESDKEAALNAYEASKAAAIIQAQINAALAITDIFAEHAGNPVALGFLTAVAAAASVAQIAAIASTPPPFHTGGIIGDPEQRQITALDGESVLNRRATAALGRDGVNALNRGQGMAPQVVALPVFKHFDKFVRDESRRGGKLTQLLDTASTYATGQRGY